MFRIGLTGGIGSGKSSVARCLSQRGARVIDADALSRQLTAPGGKALPHIAKRFGSALMLADGSMNRDAVRALVLQNPEKRLQLETILHPMIGGEIARLTEEAVQARCRCLIFDIPLLVESPHWRFRLDNVVVVDCHTTTQIDRVLSRESDRKGWTVHAVEQVIAAQASRAQRLAAADICIYNDGISMEALARLAGEVASRFGL